MDSIACAISPRRKWATSERCSGWRASSSISILVNRVSEGVDHRFEDRNDRRKFLEVGAIAVAGAVVEFFRHLRVAGGAGVAPVLMEVETAPVERGADEAQHLADMAFLI